MKIDYEFLSIEEADAYTVAESPDSIVIKVDGAIRSRAKEMLLPNPKVNATEIILDFGEHESGKYVVCETNAALGTTGGYDPSKVTYDKNGKAQLVTEIDSDGAGFSLPVFIGEKKDGNIQVTLSLNGTVVQTVTIINELAYFQHAPQEVQEARSTMTLSQALAAAAPVATAEGDTGAAIVRVISF